MSDEAYKEVGNKKAQGITPWAFCCHRWMGQLGITPSLEPRAGSYRALN